MTRALSLLLLATACDPQPAIQRSAPGEAPDQLESIQVMPSGEDLGGDDLGSGSLAISGEGRDLELRLEGDGGSFEIGLHSPALSDLSAFAGLELSAIAPESWSGDERSGLVLEDADGPVYIADGGQLGRLLTDRFGEGFATYGEVLGEETEGDWILSYTTGVFQTDDGLVELLPGEPVTIRVDGDSWRLVLIAAYETDLRPGAEEMDCGGRPPVLSFEMVLLDTAEPKLEAISRPAELDVARLPGCG